MTHVSNIRNFCIVAHIDHGKSTLADRFLELTGTVEKRAMREQTLDDMDLERERGITIKAKAVTLRRGDVILNLIDTPGHVDFSYEVSRSLQACEGAVLLVDASQGVEAQTVANTYLALEAGLEILPVLNKIDLDHARPEEVSEELLHMLGGSAEDIARVSAKTGEGAEELLDRIIAEVPPPEGDPDEPLQALIFDAVYDDYRGVITYVRIVNGKVETGDEIRMLGVGERHEVLEMGVFRPAMTKTDSLQAGEVGYLICNIKTLQDVRIGDTVTHHSRPAEKPLPGYREPKPMVFCGLYPVQNKDFDNLRKALDKLSLNDSSIVFQPETSDALGFGFRCGFLGLLHMEIVQERLEREMGLDLVQTAPNVTYQVVLKDGEVHEIDTPADLPDMNEVEEIREPIVRLSLLIPADFIGNVMKLCEDRRGSFKKQEYLSQTRVMLTYDLPLAEILYDFYDKLKSGTKGYGTMDYEVLGHEKQDLAKVRILVAGQEVDALSTICHKSVAERRGRSLLKRLRKEIPRQMFQVALQAAIGGKIIARENIAPLRKDVTAKCYGGDITRKRKLLEKQKEGKKRMKSVANVEIPQEAFMSVLSVDDDE